MANNNANEQQFTDVEKFKYYAEREHDTSLSEGQRRHATRRVEQIMKKLDASAKESPAKASSRSALPPITDKCCAESAGIGYGRAKSGQRVAVDKSVQSDFINGVKCGRSK